MPNGHALATFRKQLLAGSANSSATCRGGRRVTRYRIWLSEIMLQQTRVAAAIRITSDSRSAFRMFMRSPLRPPEEVLRLWSGLGYYSARATCKKAAQRNRSETRWTVSDTDG